MVKESLSEYGSGWEWESNTYAHVFDQTSEYVTSNNAIIPDATPIRYGSNGTVLGYCVDDWEYTNGQILLSNSLMLGQQSCKPNTGNAGNYYSWPAATAGSNISGGNASNSICPTGWQLTVNTATNPRSWQYLIRTTYNNQNSDDKNNLLGRLPMSFIRSGNYNQGSLNYRANGGYYWSSTANDSNGAYSLSSNSGSLYLQRSYNKYYGFSVRCVSR